MDPDMAMAVGSVLAVLSVPALLSALSEGRAPRVGGVVLIVAAGLILWAIANSPEGYSLTGLPSVILHVIARYIP